MLFYGYPVELIADWCAVSQHTAYLYKIGARKPSKQALRLFVLNRDGRVLGDIWKDWAVHRDKLVDPDGKETTQGQLRACWPIMLLALELANNDSKALEEFRQVLRSA
jgi:hypothetical protein